MADQTAFRPSAATPGPGARGTVAGRGRSEAQSLAELGAGGASDPRDPGDSVARDLEEAELPREAAGRLDPARPGAGLTAGEPAPGARWLFGAVTLTAAVVVLSVTLV